MKKWGLLIVLAIATSASAGEAEIIQLAPDTYMVTVKNHAGIFGHISTTKQKAIKAANKFAEGQGKIAIPVALESRGAGGPGQWPVVEYQFMVVAKDDPAAKRTGLTPKADTTIEVISDTPTSGISPTAPVKPDTYTELLKLDDLRKRGLLTDSEFDSMKRKLLDQ